MSTLTRVVKPPPRAALVGSAALVGPLLVVGLGAWWLGGVVAAMGVMLGAITGMQVAVARVDWSVRAVVGGLAVLAAGAGPLVHGHPWLAALAALVFGLVQAPLNRLSSGIGSVLPVVVAMCMSLPPLRAAPVAVMAGVAVGLVAVCVLAAVLKVRTPAEPVPRTMAVWHAVALALTAAAATALVDALDLEHGYWLVLVLAVVLRPTWRETAALARARMVGTVVGAVLSLVLVLALPAPVGLVAALACAFLSVAYSLVQDLVRQVVYLLPVIILVGSAGAGGLATDLALERLVLTAGAVVVAFAAAYLLRRLEERPDAVDPASPSPPVSGSGDVDRPRRPEVEHPKHGL